MDVIGVTALGVAAIAALPFVPESPLRHLGDPSYLALVGGELTVAVVFTLRARGVRGSRFEQVWLAAFLAGMPAVYIANLVLHGGNDGWVATEWTGFAVFAMLAFLGLRGSPWFLAAGIAAHGLLWDSWHWRTAPFVPPWYAACCLVADLGIGLYAATQVQAWKGRRSRCSGQPAFSGGRLFQD